MHWLLLASIALVLGAGPARATYYEFTGTLSFPTGTVPLFPNKGSVSGSGVASSSVAPNEIEVVAVSGFTGTISTVFTSSGNYTQQVFVTRVGTGKFSAPTASGLLFGKMGVGGKARRRSFPFIIADVPLTVDEMTGLGLGGKVPAKGWDFVNFGIWTTGSLIETSAVVESHPAMGTSVLGTLSAMGFDDRTPLGMGEIQFVAPIRAVQKSVPGTRMSFAALRLNFTPEPGRVALFLSGCIALVLLGLRRATAPTSPGPRRAAGRSERA